MVLNRERVACTLKFNKFIHHWVFFMSGGSGRLTDGLGPCLECNVMVHRGEERAENESEAINLSVNLHSLSHLRS